MKNIWELHGFKTTEKLEGNATQLIVKGVEFFPLKINVKIPFEKERKISRIKELHRIYLGQELLDAALMAAYYTNIPSFETKVQRKGKDIFIHSVKKAPIPIESDRREDGRLLGGDLEVMLRKQNGGAFVAIPFFADHELSIGTDRALLRKKNSFYQPIIELRADPQPTGLLLHKEFLRLIELLEKQTDRYHLSVVSTENPTGRFMLGGHFHISNESPSYRKASLLDALVTLPLISRMGSKSLLRRRSFGRLGSVRVNEFKGFEYRSLPSWYEFIDGGEAFFQWVETVFFNDYLPAIFISLEGIRAYYNGDQNTLKKEVEMIFSKVYPLLIRKDKEKFKTWVHWLNSI